MVIIEANIDGAKRIATFQSKVAAFYFLKLIRGVDSIVTTSVRTKIKVNSGCHLSDWSGALESARDYEESDQEFLFFTNYSDICDYLKIKNKNKYAFWSGGPHSDEIENEGKRRLDDFILSLDRKVIDIDVFDSSFNKVYLITTE